MLFVYHCAVVTGVFVLLLLYLKIKAILLYNVCALMFSYVNCFILTII